MSVPIATRDIAYPDSDGKPVAESDFQLKPLLYSVAALSRHFSDRHDVYVAGNLLIYYVEGDPTRSVAPDVFVVFGAPRRDRRSYKLWEEPKGPDFVLEITSGSTVSEDQGQKKGLYAFLGVREYFQFDPTADYLDPPLKGFRLRGDHYASIKPTRMSDGTLVVYSRVLELELWLEGEGDGDRLRFYDPHTNQPLLTYDETDAERLEAKQGRQEAERARLAAQQQADRERELRQTAESRIAELEAGLRAADERTQ